LAAADVVYFKSILTAAETAQKAAEAASSRTDAKAAAEKPWRTSRRRTRSCHGQRGADKALAAAQAELQRQAAAAAAAETLVKQAQETIAIAKADVEIGPNR